MIDKSIQSIREIQDNGVGLSQESDHQSHRHFRIRVDDDHYEFNEMFVKGNQIMERVHKRPCRYALVQIIPHSDDQFIDPDEIVDLSRHGVEKFVTVVKDSVTITVDDRPIQVGRGDMPISEIKRLAGVSDGYRLALDVDGELRDILDNSIFGLQGCEVFESRPPAGGAS